MDNGKIRNPEKITSPGEAKVWDIEARERTSSDFAGVGRKAIFSPENAPAEMGEKPPVFEITPADSTSDAPREAQPLFFTPDRIHPDRYDISKDTIQAVDDVIRVNSPSALVDNYQAMSDLYNEADAKFKHYASYIKNGGRR
ncbi:hypothetical protein IJH06_01175 [Candidatus Saccharibacteria bacterium]|nr:hypothetical protein [Candidatus Saccharibacteria bacterium]